MTAPLPCPWCHRSIAYAEPFQSDEWQVICGDASGCGAFGPLGKTKAEAVAKWNRRGTFTAEKGDAP